MIPAKLLAVVADWLGPKFGKFAAPLIYAVYAVLLIIAFLGIVKLHDRRVIRDHETHAELKQVKRERTADQNLNVQKGRDAAAAQQRQQEIDNATSNIPDQAPSARQRARACLELRRQAQQRRKPVPAC